MDTAVIDYSTFNRADLPAESAAAPETAPPFLSPPRIAADVRFELGLWLSGVESFLNVRNHSLADESRAQAATRDWRGEFRLTHQALLLCSRLAFQVERTLGDENTHLNSKNPRINRAEIFKLSQALREAILMGEGLLRASAPLRIADWTAWSSHLAARFNALEAARALVEEAESAGEKFLPEAFQRLLESQSISATTRADLNSVLPRFGKILRWLSVVETMHERDEPLKPALLVFARLYEQIQELVKYADNRLRRFPDESDHLFAALDGTAYTASIELRKVYNHELAGVVDSRQPPVVYARIETAFSLLNDSFQQTLVGFARIIDETVEPTEIFPNFQTKLKQSLALRNDLQSLQRTVRACEREPEKPALDALHKELNDFLASSIRYLFYKDTETMERFIEEVLITTDKKDLVPILHRFGAYIETLAGQVNMRAVLAAMDNE